MSDSCFAENSFKKKLFVKKNFAILQRPMLLGGEQASLKGRPPQRPTRLEQINNIS